MRVIITAILIMATIAGHSQAQTGGEISGRTKTGIRKSASMDSLTANRYAVMTSDSVTRVYVMSAKLKLDSLYSKINSTIAVTQSGTWNITNISGTISLPTGAATSAKQPDFGTAGTPSGDIITIQGRTSMTPVAVTVQDSVRVYATNGFGGGSSSGATAIYDSTRTAVAMDTAGLGAKANSATVGWQSDTVGIRQHKVTDVKIGITLDMANTAPANDKAVYVYAYPISYDGSAWDFASGGTATKPSGANSTYTIATPNNFRLLGVLSYTTADMVLTDNFMLSNVFPTMPDGFGIVVVNYSGAALAASTHKLYYSLVNKTER